MTIRLSTPLKEHVSDIAEVIHVFYPDAAVVEGERDACDVRHTHREMPGWTEETFAWGDFRETWSVRVLGDKWEQKRRRKRALKQCCYTMLRRQSGMRPPWGSLTGIRPTRLLYERLAKGDTPPGASAALRALFDLREDKAQLLMDTVEAQRGLIDAPQNAVDLYIGIPFCTTRCAYCSFFAEAVGNGKRIPPYLDALYAEMDAVAALVADCGLAPRALYVGGGTPTALTDAQLDALLHRFGAQYPTAREFTVEAGRPDTINGDKLAAMRRAGVTRISINPQTMHDKTLQAIGRAHTAADTGAAFTLARSMGFANINMDIIAALPGEAEADFAATLDAIARLGPDSLTIHTLARKHGSRYNEFGYDPVSSEVAEAMVAMGHARAAQMGMRPYYLYRQKYVAGNLENTAYAMPGSESLYNIDIMEETTSILAMGAGAISKRIFHGENRIERAPNVGDVGHYTSRVPEMIARKERLWADMRAKTETK